jgi:hypothetical protein
MSRGAWGLGLGGLAVVVFGATSCANMNQAPSASAIQGEGSACPEGQVIVGENCNPQYEVDIQTALKARKESLDITIGGKEYNLTLGPNNGTWFGRTSDGKTRYGGANTVSGEPVFRSTFETPGVDQKSADVKPGRFDSYITLWSEINDFRGYAVGWTDCGGEGKYKNNPRTVLAVGVMEKSNGEVSGSFLNNEDVIATAANVESQQGGDKVIFNLKGKSSTGAVCQWGGLPDSKEYIQVQGMARELKERKQPQI